MTSYLWASLVTMIGVITAIGIYLLHDEMNIISFFFAVLLSMFSLFMGILGFYLAEDVETPQV